ncbi:MAG: enoyl-ACP reductase FabI [Pseudomonadota bacterium]
MTSRSQPLAGKKGLILGIANEHSIAYGCAKAFHDDGAELAITYGTPKAEPYVRPLAEALNSPIFQYCDLLEDDPLDALFARITDEWGRLDFALHSVAFAPRDDLHGPLSECSRQGFTMACDVSCHSFMRLAKLSKPLMTRGGALLTMSYFGAQEVVENYGVMGPVKAALESTVRYLAVELGPQAIRVNAISPGPIPTRAASGIAHFDDLITMAQDRSPGKELVTIDDVGALAAFLVSDRARRITGNISFVDAGLHVVA